MKNDNLLPFDLNVALAYPERVVTRVGDKVSQLTKFNLTMSGGCLVGVVNFSIKMWGCDGITDGRERNSDLALLPESKVFYCNVYHDSMGLEYDELEYTRRHSTGTSLAILCIKITGSTVTAEILPNE